MRIPRPISFLVVIALAAISMFHALNIVQAGGTCDSGTSISGVWTIDQLTGCTGSLDGQNNTANSLTNENTLNGTILGGQATSADTSDTIENVLGAKIQNTSGDSYIYGGDNFSNTSNFTTNVTNDGTITNTSGFSAYIYDIANTSNSGNQQDTLTNNGTISVTLATNAFIQGAYNHFSSGSVTNTLTNNGTMSSPDGGHTFIADNSVSPNPPYNASTSGDQTDIMTNNGDMISGVQGETFIYGTYNATTSGDEINTLTNTKNMITGDGGSAFIFTYGNESTSGSQTDTILNSGTITSGDNGHSYLQVTYSYSNMAENATITNSGDLTSGDNGTAVIEGSYSYNAAKTGAINNMLTNTETGNITTGDSGSSFIEGDINYSNTTVTNNMTNAGHLTSGNYGRAVIFGSDNAATIGIVTNTIVNSGTISAGTNSAASITGGNNGAGTTTNNITVIGTITTTDGTSFYVPVYGGNNSGSGTLTNNITVSGTITTADNGVSIYGGNNTGGGTMNSTYILSGADPTISGIISGDSLSGALDDTIPKSQAQGGAQDQLTFEMQTTNKAKLDDWNSQVTTLMNANGGVMPSHGILYWGDTPLQWQDMDELENLVKLLGVNFPSLVVTWFNPTDGRFNGQPAERIVIYCHADKNNLGVLLVNNQSAGNIGTAFDIKKLEALGKGGTTVSFGNEGILSIMMDNQGNGYAAWNGGIEGANGQGDFAKTFICPLPS